jgi:hypothetical protein
MMTDTQNHNDNNNNNTAVGDENQDPLDVARELLQKSGKSMQSYIRLAHTQIEYLRLVQVRQEDLLKAASDRLSRVKTITSRLCDECFSFLPVLGKSFEDLPEVPYYYDMRDHSLPCCSCGNYSMIFQSGASIIELPPPVGGAFDLCIARWSREHAEGVLAGGGTGVTHGFPGVGSGAGSGINAGVDDIGVVVSPVTDSASADSGEEEAGVDPCVRARRDVENSHVGASSGFESRVGATTGNNDVIGFNQSEMTKAKLVELAQNYRGRAAVTLYKTEYALRQWEIFRSQYRDELDKIKISLLTVKTKQKNILKKKLRELDGGENTSNNHAACVATMTQLLDCPICLEEPKEIVFQCGHQSCHNCSPRLTRCHTCRACISQRIKLYH